jgi:hypothetical protein
LGEAVASVSGTLKVGEANATASAVMSRRVGSLMSYVAIGFGLMFGGALLAIAISFLLSNGAPADYGQAGGVGWILGVIVWLLTWKAIMTARFKRKFRDQGQPVELTLRMDVLPDHLRYELGGVTKLASWPSVTEVIGSHDYWIFLAQSEPFYAPRRMFPDEASEKSFLREALSLMTKDARERSTAAVQASSGSADGEL